jgi:hypothetical protein
MSEGNDIKPMDAKDVFDRILENAATERPYVVSEEEPVDAADALGDEILRIADSRSDRPEPEAPVVDDREARVATVVGEMIAKGGVTAEELAAQVEAHPELFPGGSAQTDADFRLAMETAAALAVKDRDIAVRDHVFTSQDNAVKEAAAYEAAEAIEYSTEPEEIYEALSELEARTGNLQDPYFSEVLANVLQSEDEDHKEAAQAWVAGRLGQLEQEAAQIRARAEAKASIARAENDAAHQKLVDKTMAIFKAKHMKVLVRHADTFATLAPAVLNVNDTEEDLSAALELTLKAAVEADRTDARIEQSARMDEAFFGRDPAYRDANGNFVNPMADVVQVTFDEKKLERKAPRGDRLKTFGDAFDSEAGKSRETRSEIDRAFKRSEQIAAEREAKYGKLK